MQQNRIAHEHRRIGLVFFLALLAMTPGFAADPEHLDIAAYEGQVLVVDFWASWCVPCRRSFPWLNAMHDKYGERGLVIIGVNLDESRQDAEAFLAEYPPRFRIWYDESKAIAHEFDVMAMPMSYIIGRDGNQVARHFGFKVKKQDEYEAVIIDALSQEE